MKENDYILANILNPDFNNQDFKDILGMSMENTQILPYSSYTSSPFITLNELFQDNSGNFSELKFKNFYTDAVGKFSSFNTDQPVLDNFEYGLFDTSRKPNSRVKDPGLRFDVISNPERISTGILGRNLIETSKLSNSEKAQQSKIWDSKKGKWLDYSPNDVSLTSNPLGWIKSLFDEPLVKATWDNDGEHQDPITKRMVKHYKGELKLNNEGQYFYETLGGRSLIGKETLSAFDTLTVDGEGLNKYDFIDSDGLDKSVVGTIAKTALTVAPLFLGPEVAAVYGGVLVARELAKSLPMLYGMVSSLWGNEEDSKTLNTIAAYGEKFTSGTSEHSKQNMLTVENIASLIGDVATQWGQQKTIAKSINKLKGSDKLVEDAYKKAASYYALEAKSIEQGAMTSLTTGSMKGLSPMQYIGDPSKWQESALGKAAIKKFVHPAQDIALRNMRLGADASLAYMAIISNTDVYSSMLEHGASKKDAATVAFGSMLGMFAVDKYLGLGELFFDELRVEQQLALRGALKKEAASVAESLTGTIKNTVATPEVKQNFFKDLVKKGMTFSKNVTGKFAEDVKNHTTGFLGKSLGEGLEEVSEELVADLSKQLYEIAGEFSPNFINESRITDVGAFENAKERYFMSLLGGAVGGGIFYGVEMSQKGSFKRDASKDELIYLVANNRTQETLDELNRWKAAGKFGSKTLSATKYELDSNGNPVFLTADNELDSQNTFVYNRIKDSILQLENILNQTGTNLSEDDLFKQMVLSELRFLNLKDFLQDQSYTTKYQEQFRVLTRKLIDAEQNLSNSYNTVDGTPSGQKLPDSVNSQTLNDPIRLQNLEKLKLEVEQLRAERDSFINGEQSLPFTEKMLFAIDPYLNGSFVSMTYNNWLKANKNKTIDELTPAEKQTFREEYLNYKRTKQSLDLDKSFEIYKSILKVVDPYISTLSLNSSEFQKNHETLLKLFDEDGPLANLKTISYDDKLEDESDEEFNNRKTKLENEFDEEFQLRVITRLNKINQYNQQQLQNLNEHINKIIEQAGGYIDPAIQRMIHRSFNSTRNEVATDVIHDFINYKKYSFQDNYNHVLDIIKKLKPDLSNIDSVKQDAAEAIKNIHKINLAERNELLKPIVEAITTMFDDFGFQYDINTITGDTVLLFMNDIASKIQNNDEFVFSKFAEIGREDVLNDLLSSTDLVNDLMNYDSTKNGFLEYYLGEEGANIYEDEWNPIGVNIINGKDNYEMWEYSEDEINLKAEEMSAPDNDLIRLLLTELKDAIESNPFVKTIDDVDKTVTDNNPVVKLLKDLNIALDSDNRNINNILEILHQKYLNIDNVDNFLLSEEEEDSIREAVQLLSTVKAYIYAAGSDSNYAFPVGHNKVINEFAKKHSDIFKSFEELPTLDQSVADTFLLEIDKYLRELSDEYEMSWISLSNKNKINKKQQFINTEIKFTKAKLEFFNVANESKSMQFTINGRNYNLLEGIESITDDNDNVKLHKIENLFYINLHKAMSENLNFKLILQESKMLETLLDINKITFQHTAELDSTINYGKLTDFDKFTYLLTISGISSNEFQNFIKDRIQESQQADLDKKIVPLTIQEQISRIALAQIKNKEIFSQALEYLNETTENKKPILDYLIFISGSAGTGKTQVIANYTAKFVDSDDIWLSAPKDTLLSTLKSVIGKGESKSRKELFDLIIDSETYQQLLNDIRGSSQDEKKLISIITQSDENTSEVVDLDKIKFNDILNPPKLIIIDEITHFSGAEMQVLNAFAKKNGISIIALGDVNQNGFTGFSRNIDREKIIAIRSPKLSISLRDVNLLKQENLLNTINILNGMSELDTDDPDYKLKFNNFINLINRINFRVYDKEEINGDLITKSLTSSHVNKLFGKVAFVGDTNGETYRILKDHGNNIEEVIVLNPDEIQGQEFDFIIVDLNWSLDTRADVYVYNFLTNLYTLMSRGKTGSIFIDNGLSNIIGENKTSFRKEQAPSLKDAAESFINSKLEILEQLNLISNEEFENFRNNSNPQSSSSTQLTQTPTQPSSPLTTNTRTPLNALTLTYIPLTNSQPPTLTTPAQTPEEELSNEFLPEDESLQVEDDIMSNDEAEQSRKNIIESLNDKTEEIIEKSLQEIELDPDYPIRIYGSAHFSGLIKTEKEINGEKTTVYVNPNSEVKSDLQIFMKDDEADGAEMHSLVSSLLNLKSVLLYDRDPRLLHSSVSSIVDAEHLKNIKYKLEVRPRLETDNFVGYTGLLTDGEDGNRPDINGLVYTLIGEFENNNGELCKITLGLLANPDSFKCSEFAINKGKEVEVNAKISAYRNVFNNITNQYHRDGKFNQPITIQLSGLTHIRRTTHVGKLRRPVKVRNLTEFRKAHPYTVISDPYIFIGTNFKGVKASEIRGKAVVFVSNDTTLNPKDLMQTYINQKENADTNSDIFNQNTKPRVRMLLLDTTGVSFKSLTFTLKMKSLYNTTLSIKGEEIIKLFPFEEDYMGIRMYTSLWNYRVNLLKFINAYNNFNWKLQDGTKLTDDDIIRIARYADALYSKNSNNTGLIEENAEIDEDVTDINKILSETKATEEELNLLAKFNDSLASEVRLFRIGGSRKKSGVYLRNLTNISSDNTFYLNTKGTPVGIYIDPKTAQRQYELINTLLNEVLGAIIDLKDSNGQPWPSTKSISSKKGFNNSLKGLIKDAFADGFIEFEEDGITYKLQLPSKKTFKHVPIILQKVYQQLRLYQNDPADFEYKNIIVGKKNGNPVPINFSKLITLVNTSFGDDFDSIFDDLLALAFHGTTADPTKPGMRATDAYFKQGFFVDPMGAEVVAESSSGSALFKRCLTNELLFKVDAEVDMPIFTITLTELEKVYDDSTIIPAIQEEIIPQNIKEFWSNPVNVHPDILNDVLNLFSTVKSIEEFYLKAHDIVNQYNLKELIPSLFENRTRPALILNTTWYMNQLESKNITVQQYLEELSGKSFEGAKISWDNENILVTLNDGITHLKVNFDTYSSNFTITTIMEKPEINQNNSEEKSVNKLQIAQNYINIYLADSKNAEKIENLKSDYEQIYNELKANIGTYSSIDDLIKALTGMEEFTDWNDVIQEIKLLVTSINEGLDCNYN